MTETELQAEIARDRDRLADVFTYFVNQQKVYGDPLAIRRRLIQASGGQIRELMQAAFSPPTPSDATLSAPTAASTPDESSGQPEPTPAPSVDPQAALAMKQAQAEDALLAVVRHGFRLSAFDDATGEGVLDDVCWHILSEYTEYMTAHEEHADHADAFAASDPIG